MKYLKKKYSMRSSIGRKCYSEEFDKKFKETCDEI